MSIRHQLASLVEQIDGMVDTTLWPYPIAIYIYFIINVNNITNIYNENQLIY